MLTLLLLTTMPDLRLDEQFALTLLLGAVAGLVHAFSYTAAEGGHPSQRWVFRWAANALAVVTLYVIVRVWL